MRIFCIGRNYAAHAAELKNEVPTEPVVFLKPESCLVELGKGVAYPSHGSQLHHEAEIVVEIGKDCKGISQEDAVEYISKLGLGLDLTLRDVQDELKSKKLPWEKAKAFDDSSPLGKMVDFENQNIENMQIACEVNGEVRQNGNSEQMIFSIKQIISYLSSIWSLKKGDLIYTGTPSGVGEIKKGDQIRVFSEHLGEASWRIL